MIVKRFYDDTLAQASYLIGCGRTGNAIVIDPSRDIDQYLRMAEAEEVAVTHVTETHIHADFVSGSRELAVRTGAALYLSAEGGPDWQYAYARDAGRWPLEVSFMHTQTLSGEGVPRQWMNGFAIRLYRPIRGNVLKPAK